MRIGIDLDGCVYNFVDAMRQHFDGDTDSHPEPTHWHIWDCWGMSEDEWNEAVAAAKKNYVFDKDGCLYVGAKEALDELRAQGHELHVVTARLGRDAQMDTLNWLDDAEIPHDTVTFAMDKTLVDVDVFIEDNLHNARALKAAGRHVYLMDRPWNQGDRDIPIVMSWRDFVNEVSHLDARQASDEMRVTSSTGGAKGSKREQYSLIPVESLAEVARVYAYGADKYTERNAAGEVVKDGRDNWRLGYPWHLSYDAMQRHVNEFWAGKRVDESGHHPLGHAAFHCLAMMYWDLHYDRYSEFDTRPKGA